MIADTAHSGRRKLGQVDLNLLFTLYEVGRLGSVTAAARELGRTQPAISQRVRQLEDQLGVPLFERSGPVLRLTAIGRAVLEEVGLVVAQLGTVLDRTRDLDAAPVGTVRVGALPTVCAYILAPVAVRLARAHARAAVKMVPGLTAPQLDALRGGDIDVLISVGQIRDRSLEVTTLGEIDACVVAPSRLRLPRGALAVRDLESHDLVGYGEIGDPFFDAVWKFLDRTDLARRIRIEVAHIQTIKQLVLGGGGVSILPRYTVVESTLTARALRGLDVRMPLCVVTRPRGDAVPVVRALLDELAREIAITRGPPRRDARRGSDRPVR